MTRLPDLRGVALLVAMLCAACDRPLPYLLVRVSSGDGVAEVAQLQVMVNAGGRSNVVSVPAARASLTLPRSFSLELPPGVVGRVGVAITALDRDGVLLAQGNGSTEITAEGTTPLDVALFRGQLSDGGAGDGQAGCGSPPVLPPSVLSTSRFEDGTGGGILAGSVASRSSASCFGTGSLRLCQVPGGASGGILFAFYPKAGETFRARAWLRPAVPAPDEVTVVLGGAGLSANQASFPAVGTDWQELTTKATYPQTGEAVFSVAYRGADSCFEIDQIWLGLDP
jgi:hypothetical protein